MALLPSHHQFSDLFVLMDLLSNLLNKDVVDFWSVDENSNPSGAETTQQVIIFHPPH